jgi:hypothetical protein
MVDFDSRDTVNRAKVLNERPLVRGFVPQRLAAWTTIGEPQAAYSLNDVGGYQGKVIYINSGAWKLIMSRVGSIGSRGTDLAPLVTW